MNQKFLAVAVVAATISTASCQQESVRKSALAGELRSPQKSLYFGGEVHVLPLCKTLSNYGQLNVVSHHLLEIKDLNIRKLTEKWKNTDDSSDSPPPGQYPTNHGKTRWDISLGLKQSLDAASLTVTLKDTGNDKLKFISSTYAITAGDAYSVNRFCLVDSNYTDHHVEILALYDASVSNPQVISSINIGIDVLEGASGFSIPIHIDPNVKNNG